MTSKAFFDLLRRRRPRNAAAIDARIERDGVTEKTVLMSDSSGFSRKTHDFGILQFLAVMTQCYDKLIPFLKKHRGLCLANNADNILGLFDDPQDAVRAAVDMQRWLIRRNKGLPEKEAFNICIGIHHGELIRLSDNVYGETVNVAAKVGEDLASKDQVLVTDAVKQRLGRGFKTSYTRSTELGGRTYELHRVLY